MRIMEATKALEGFQTRKALQDSFFLFKKDIDHFFYRIEHESEDETAMQEIPEVMVYILRNMDSTDGSVRTPWV